MNTAFIKQYQPIREYEINELAEVRTFSPSHVWTVITNDAGDLEIVPGIRFVNRYAYIVTTRPHNEQLTFQY